VFWLVSAALIFTGCFTIPFIKKGGGEEEAFEPVSRDFDRINVFVGYDKEDRPIVELRLVSQDITENGLIIHTRLFPTENFKVHNVFRGLRSINYYPIERRFHRLELRYGKKKIKTKIKENLQVRGTKPVDANFEHTGIHSLLPDTIDRLKLKFQDVDRWDRLPQDSLDNWYTVKEDLLQELDRKQRRRSLIDTYRQRQKKDETKIFTQYDTIYVTTNNTYVYLEKNVDSDILFTLNAGEKIDYGISDGVWVEIPLPDSLRGNLNEFLEARRKKALNSFETQRQAARIQRAATSQPQTEIDTTSRFTAYILDVMVQKKYSDAVDWEKERMVEPVDVPLFAQVLRDRELAKQARADSIVKARADSLAHIQYAADSLARAKELADSLNRAKEAADSTLADSTKAPVPKSAAAAASDSAHADSVKAVAPKSAAAAASDSALADSVKAVAPKSAAAAASDSALADSVKVSAPPGAASPADSSRNLKAESGKEPSAIQTTTADTLKPGAAPLSGGEAQNSRSVNGAQAENNPENKKPQAEPNEKEKSSGNPPEPRDPPKKP